MVSADKMYARLILGSYVSGNEWHLEVFVGDEGNSFDIVANNLIEDRDEAFAAALSVAKALGITRVSIPACTVRDSEVER